jgi:cytoskeleton protein RodZ
MPTLGETLRQAREKREIPIDDVSRETRIAARYLEALEKGELAELPGSTFGKGYLRTYARYLGLDPEPLVEIYLEEEAEQTREGQIAPAPDVLDGLRESVGRGGPEPGETARRVLRFALPVVLVLGLVAVVFLVVLPWLRSSGEEPSPRAVAVTAAPAPTPEARPTLASPSPPPSDDNRRDAAPEDTSIDASRGTSSAEGTPTAPAKPAPSSIPSVEETPSAEPEPVTARATAPPASSEPPSAPATRSAPESATDAARLSVSEAGVGTAVVNRTLQGESDRFAEGTRIVFWTRVLGGQRGDEIRHVWIREGVEVGSVSLAVNASHWRTHSRRTLGEGSAGSWAVEARDAAGRVLVRREFRCEAGRGE